MATTVLDLHEIGSISSEDLLHIIDVTESNEDSKVDIGTLTTYLNTALSIPQTIASVNGLQAALDGKSDKGHTHTIQQIIGLSSALADKTDVSQAQIIGRDIILNGKSINVPSAIAGTVDSRIPNTVVVGDYLQFDTTGGGIAAITGTTLKNNLQIDAVDNTSDANKPVSTLQRAALDLKVNTSAYNTKQASQDTGITENTAGIQTNAGAIFLNTQKVSFDSASSIKLAGIESGADVTDTGNVWSSLGISGSGSTEQYLTQRGVFAEQATATSVTKSAVDNAIGRGSEGTDYYSSSKTWLPIPTGGGTGTVTKAVVDAAIGVFPTGDSAQFYNEQGNFIDAVYDSIEDAPIIRTRTIEDILINGTRSNVQVRESGDSETSTITMQNTFNPLPTQYTSIFTSPNTSFSPALVLPTGSQGRQLSLTEADGTLHRFAYTTNGNYRLLDGGLTGTVRLGAVAVATTATVTATVSVPDQTAGQTITLTGDQTGVFSVGDFISPLSNNFGAYRGIFIESVTLNGGNTDIVGTSNGAATFNTTSTLYLAGPADTIQGTIPTFSYDPDTADAVYTAAVVAQGFTGTGVGIIGHITQIANAIVGLDAAITWDGVITSDGTSTNIVSNSIGFRDTLNVGINQWSIITNTSGFPGVVPTIGDAWSTINGHFLTESSFTTNRLYDAVAVGDIVRLTWGDGSASFPVTSKGSRSTLLGDAFNVVGTIDRTFTDAEAFTLEAEVITSTTSSITIDLGTETNISSSFTISGGENNMNTLVNTDGAIGPLSPATTITVIDPEATEITSFTSFVTDANDNNIDSIGQQITDAVNGNFETPIDFRATYDNNTITLTATAAGNTNPWTIVFNNNGATTENAGNLSATISQTGEIINQMETVSVTDGARIEGFTGVTQDNYIEVSDTTNAIAIEAVSITLLDGNGVSSMRSITDSIIFNPTYSRRSFYIQKEGSGTAFQYDVVSDTLTTTAANVVGFGGGADGLSITDTVNLNLLQGTTVLDTVVLPSAGGTTIVQGTTDEIDVATVGDTNTISLATAITGAITANTAKNTYPAADATKLATISTNADVTLDSISAGNNITISGAGVIASTASGTADSVVRQPAGSTIAPIKFWTGTQAQYNALTPVNDVLYNITDTAEVTLVSSVVGTANEVDVTTVDGQATVSLDSVITGAITANTSKLSGIEAGADVTDTTNVVGSLTAGTNITIATDGTISAASGGTTTTVQGTTNQIDVNTIGSTATVSLDTAITSAITANTAKTGITTIQSGEITANTAKIGLESLNQVGGAIIGSDSIAYLDNTTPRRKTFNLVPLSIFNNDAGFTTNAGTVTSINGTTDEVDVTSGATPTVSLSSTITDAIDANTSKTGISTAQANAITANTAKVGITTAQSNAITTNTAKVGITTAQASAITANTAKTGITSAQATAITNNTAKVGITTAQTTKLAGLSADSVDRQTAGSTTAPIKFWTGTQNQYNALTPVSDVLYNITDTTFTSIVSSVLGTADEIDVNISGTTAILSLDNTVTSAINANTDKVGITTVQATAITTNTAKTGITTTQANNIVTNNAKVSVSGLNQVGGAIIASDSILYYDNTTPRRKTFSLVPLSVFNNDAGFSTSSGTVTSVSGTNNQVNVASGTTTPVISLDSSITSAITANTSKNGITTAQANAITANTSKTGITTAQATAITNNTAKTGISTAQASAITANTAKNSYPSADATKLATLSADSIDRQANGSTEDPVKFWTGTNSQYNALTPVSDVFYNITDSPEVSVISSVLGTTNEVDVSVVNGTATVSLDNTITNAVTANTAKVTYTDLLPLNNTFTGNNTFTQGIARETGGSTTNGIKFWSGTEAQYNTLGTGRDQNTVYYLTDI